MWVWIFKKLLLSGRTEDNKVSICLRFRGLIWYCLANLRVIVGDHLTDFQHCQIFLSQASSVRAANSVKLLENGQNGLLHITVKKSERRAHTVQYYDLV